MDSNNRSNRIEYAQPINTSSIIDVSATLKQFETTLYSIACSMRSDIWVAKEKVRNSPETCTKYVCNETESENIEKCQRVAITGHKYWPNDTQKS